MTAIVKVKDQMRNGPTLTTRSSASCGDAGKQRVSFGEDVAVRNATKGTMERWQEGTDHPLLLARAAHRYTQLETRGQWSSRWEGQPTWVSLWGKTLDWGRECHVTGLFLLGERKGVSEESEGTMRTARK